MTPVGSCQRKAVENAHDTRHHIESGRLFGAFQSAPGYDPCASATGERSCYSQTTAEVKT